MDTAIPENYFPEDDPTKPPMVKWRSHANLLYANWLNYYVYQETPYDLGKITDNYLTCKSLTVAIQLHSQAL